MNANEILAKLAARNSVKGPRPKLNVTLDAFLAKHAERLPVTDLDAAITKLTEIRNANATFEAEVAQAKAEVAQAEAQKAIEAAKAATAATTPAPAV